VWIFPPAAPFRPSGKPSSRNSRFRRHFPDYEALSRVRRFEDLSKQLARSDRGAGRSGCGLHEPSIRRAGAVLPLTTSASREVSVAGVHPGEWDGQESQGRIALRVLRDICKIFQKHDVSFSQRWPRPGSVACSDEAQFCGAETLGDLHDCVEYDVKVMIEGPGHIPRIRSSFSCRRKLSWWLRSSFYPLGPLVTDIAPGYDHITSAIRGGHDRLVWRLACSAMSPRRSIWVCRSAKT